jgi:serine/threonine-protein kinase
LGKFEITGKLGEGGMATVYRARDTTVGRDVAIKVIIAKLADNPDLLKRFEREARTVATLDHPHILKVFDVGQQDNLLYLVMELKTGGSLASLIRGGSLPLGRVAKLLSQIASALDYAHENGIVHRDLKPQNVLLDAQQNAILTDFGIAKVQQADMTALTMTGMAMGTPAYMAPEQWQGGVIDARTDIYALGIMLFEMLTGRVPFTAETPYQLMFAHVQQQPPTVREVRDDVKPPIDQVVLKALAKDPAQRYGSAGELSAAFRAAVGGDSYAPGLSAALAAAAQGAAPTPAPIPSTLNMTAPERIPTAKGTQTLPIDAAGPNATTTPNRPPLALIGGGIAVVVIGVIAALLLASRPPTGAEPSTIAPTTAATTAVAMLPDPSATPSSTLTATALPPTATSSATALPTNTSTVTSSATPTTTATFTATLPPTPTVTLTATPSATFTKDAVAETAFALATEAVVMSQTAAAASPTPSATPTFTRTTTATASATPTASPSNTVTATRLKAITATPIILPDTSTPPPTRTATVAPTRQPPTAGPSVAITATPLVLPTLPPTAVALNTSSRTDDQGIAQVWIEAACFEMGSTEEEITEALRMGRQYNSSINRQAVADELPTRDVCLSKGYWIDVYEVTNAAFQQFVDAGGYSTESYWSTDGWAWVRRTRVRGPATDCGEQNDVADLPKTCVSWFEAEAYAAWRGGRLPTEAEWEYAARGKDRNIFPWGNTFDGTRLNYCDVNCQNDWRDTSVDDGYAYHAPVGSYPGGVSWCGAHDMAGNVWEWTQDWYNESTYARAVNNDPTGPARGISRVLRGGSRGRMSESVRGANRFLSRPTERVDGVGFRIVSPS